ncbi:hypothetical protein BJX62DRAFT_239323 [Aspergillus germanicus]
MSAFGYVFWGEDALGPDPQQLWADDELYRTLPQHTPYGRSLKMNDFPRTISCVHPEATVLTRPPPPPMGTLSAIPFSAAAQPNPQPQNMLTVMPYMSHIEHQAIPAAHPHTQIKRSTPEAFIPIRPADHAKDNSPRLQWGSDRRFTIFGYSVPRGHVREEQIIQRLLSNNSLFILQFCRTAARSVDGASEDCNTGTGPVANSMNDNSGVTSQDGDIKPQATDTTALSVPGNVSAGEKPPHKRQKLENDMQSAKRRRVVANRKFEELQSLIPVLKDQSPSKSQILNEAYRWIIQLQDQIDILKALMDEIEFPKGCPGAEVGQQEPFDVP